MPRAVFDAFFQLGLLEDPLKVGWSADGDLIVALAAVLLEMKPGVERGLAGPLHELAPTRLLDQLLEDCRDNDIEGGAVR